MYFSLIERRGYTPSFFTRNSSLVGCVARGNGFDFFWLGRRLNTPATRDLDVKVEDRFSLGPFDRNELSIRGARPTSPARYNYFLPTFRAETLRIFCLWKRLCVKRHAVWNVKERRTKLGGLSPASRMDVYSPKQAVSMRKRGGKKKEKEEIDGWI